MSSAGAEDPSLLLIGPGAIGCAVAAALVESGRSVTVAARTGFDRLQVNHPAGQVDVPAHPAGQVDVPVHPGPAHPAASDPAASDPGPGHPVTVRCVTDPTAAGPADVVFLAVKAHQTTAAAPWLDAAVSDRTTVVVLQNGVEHVARVEPLVPAGATVVPAVVFLPAMRSEPGRVTVSSEGGLTLPAGPPAERVHGLFDSSFLSIRLAEDWLTAAWVKLMMNAASGAIGVLTGRPNGVMGADDDVRALSLALMREVAAVARAEGADIDDDRVESILDRIVAGAGTHVSSIVADRLAGHPTEWDARNAVIGRLAERHGIDVPLNRAFTTVIRLGEPEIR